MPPVPEDLRQRLRQYGQDHVLSGWDELNDREQRVMRLRFRLDGAGDAILQEDLAKEMKLSRERIRQIEVQAIKKLRALPSAISAARRSAVMKASWTTSSTSAAGTPSRSASRHSSSK